MMPDSMLGPSPNQVRRASWSGAPRPAFCRACRGETAEVQGARFTVSVSRSEQGNLALIANNSDHVVKITSNHGMETSLASRQSASWACRPGSFVASLVIATEEGGFIASPELRCGEALYLTEGE